MRKQLLSMGIALTAIAPQLQAKVSMSAYEHLTNNPIVFVTSARQSQPEYTSVLLDIVFIDFKESDIQLLVDAGLKVRSANGKYGRATVEASTTSQLDSLKAMPNIQYVYKVIPPITNAGSVESQAVKALGISDYPTNALGLTGKGVSIGVISDSMSHSNTRDPERTGNDDEVLEYGFTQNLLGQQSGDMPSSIWSAYDDINNGSTSGEGAAMIELIHDIAPDSEISFHSAGLTMADFAEAIDHLCQPEFSIVDLPYYPTGDDSLSYSHGLDKNKPALGLGMDIVVDDIAFVRSLAFQDDIAAIAANECFERGSLYVTSAGNLGDAAQAIDWNHMILPAPIVIPNGLDLSAVHNWGTADNPDDSYEITIGPNQTVMATLHWSQPALSTQSNKVNPPTTDFDLVALWPNGEVFEKSMEPQDGTINAADPVEVLMMRNDHPDHARTFKIYIAHRQGDHSVIRQADRYTDMEIRLTVAALNETESGFPILEYPGSDRIPAMTGQQIAKGALTIAAAPYWESPTLDQSGGATAEIDVESFTSRGGPIRKYFDSEGNFKTTNDIVSKPDLTAFDGINTTFYGTQIDDGDNHPNFFGTSAAATNAAASAALLLENRDQSSEELYSSLKCRVVDVAGERAKAGRDYVSGEGLLQMQLPIITGPTTFYGEPGKEITVINLIGYEAKFGRVAIIEQLSGPTINYESTYYRNLGRFTPPNEDVTYTFKFNPRDRCGAQAEAIITLHITQKDETAPVVITKLLATESLEEVSFNFSAEDPETGIHAAEWKKVSGPEATVSEINFNSGSFSFNPSEYGEYKYSITLTNGFGLETTSELTILVSDITPPDIGYTVSALSESDPASDLLLTIEIEDLESTSDFTWVRAEGPGALPEDLIGSNQASVQLHGQVSGTYSFAVIATNVSGIQAAKEFTVVVDGVTAPSEDGTGSSTNESPSETNADSNNTTGEQASGSSGGGGSMGFVLPVIALLMARRKNK